MAALSDMVTSIKRESANVQFLGSSATVTLSCLVSLATHLRSIFIAALINPQLLYNASVIHGLFVLRSSMSDLVVV